MLPYPSTTCRSLAESGILRIVYGIILRKSEGTAWRIGGVGSLHFGNPPLVVLLFSAGVLFLLEGAYSSLTASNFGAGLISSI